MRTYLEVVARLQREYINAVRVLATIAPKIETAAAKLKIA